MKRRELLYGLFAGSILSPLRGWAAMPRFEGLRNTVFGVHESHEMLAYRNVYRFDLPTEIEHYWGRVNAGGFSIFQHYFKRSGAPTCLLLHGYLDHSGLYGDMICELIREGWSVCAFDLPGHGLSSGERGGIHDFEQYQACLKDVINGLESPPVAVVGHSTGAAVLANCILDGLSFPHAAFVSPLLHSQAWLLSKIGVNLVPRHLRIPRRRAEVSSDPEFQRFRVSDPLYETTMPMTWVHAMFRWARTMENKEPSPSKIVAFFGDRDVIIDQNASARIYEKLFPNADIRWFQGGNHHLLFEVESIRASVRKQLYLSIAPGLESV